MAKYTEIPDGYNYRSGLERIEAGDKFFDNGSGRWIYVDKDMAIVGWFVGMRSVITKRGGSGMSNPDKKICKIATEYTQNKGAKNG